MTSPYAHLGLRAWPFAVVPRPEHCTFLAGRNGLRTDIASLLHSLSRKDVSSIHVLWSWLGAGKTHSLHYIVNQAKLLSASSPPVPLSTIYTEFPRQLSSFADLYRSFVRNLSHERLSESFLEIATGSTGDSFQEELLLADPDLATAMRVLTINTGEARALAIRWLRGEKLVTRALQKLDVSQSIATTDKAVRAMSVLIRILGEAARLRGHLGLRVLWLIDEFQRASLLNRRLLGELNTGLHSLFNACPVGLTPILSFTSPPEQRTLPPWFSPELRSRIGTTKVMILPPLQPKEALDFIKEVLDHFRPDSYAAPNPFFPFTEATCLQVIQFVRKRTQLLPRSLLHALNALLEAADPEVEKGTMSAIAPSFAEKVLSEYVVLSSDEHSS